MKKTIRGAALLGAITLSMAILQAAETQPTKPQDAKPAAKAKADPLFNDEVVAKAKGVEIKRSEVEEAFIAYKATMASRGNMPPLTDEQRPELESKLTERLAVTRILLTKATDADKAKAKENTAKMLEDARKSFPNEEMFKQQLTANGLTLEQFQARLNEQSTCEEVVGRELKSTVKVTDADVKKFYDENPDRFEQPEQVRASHILISTLKKDSEEPLPAAEKKAKEELAKKLKARVDKGEDFAKLAKEFSEDPGSKDKGGEYIFGKGRMVPEFETAAFSLKTNQVSDVVETKFGYHIIKLSEKIPAQKVELAKVSDEIKEGLSQMELQKRLPDYIEKVKADANLQILNKPAAAAPKAEAGAKPLEFPKK